MSCARSRTASSFCTMASSSPTASPRASSPRRSSRKRILVPPMSEKVAPLLQLESVNTHIGPYHILQGVELAVPRGGLTMLLGRNGAGKTTTLRTVMGLWRASAGRVRFEGAEITAWATPDIARAGIAYVPENMGIFADLTVRENLLLAARAGDIDEVRLRWVFGLFPALKKFWSLPAGFLSGGRSRC